MNYQERLIHLRNNILEYPLHLYTIDNPIIKEACALIDWKISPPYAQWNYPHLTTSDGVVLPFTSQAIIKGLNSKINEFSNNIA